MKSEINDLMKMMDALTGVLDHFSPNLSTGLENEELQEVLSGLTDDEKWLICALGVAQMAITSGIRMIAASESGNQRTRLDRSITRLETFFVELRNDLDASKLLDRLAPKCRELVETFITVRIDR